MSETNYEKYFEPELTQLDTQYNKNEELYQEVHKSLEKNLDRMEGKAIFGTTSPHRDVAELGKVLNDIRGNQVSTIREKSNIKKNIKDLELRRENMKQGNKDNQDAQLLMKELISNIQAKNPEISRATEKEKTNLAGREFLDKLNPNDIGVNENDLKMIRKFKQGN